MPLSYLPGLLEGFWEAKFIPKSEVQCSFALSLPRLWHDTSSLSGFSCWVSKVIQAFLQGQHLTRFAVTPIHYAKGQNSLYPSKRNNTSHVNIDESISLLSGDVPQVQPTLHFEYEIGTFTYPSFCWGTKPKQMMRWKSFEPSFLLLLF